MAFLKVKLRSLKKKSKGKIQRSFLPHKKKFTKEISGSVSKNINKPLLIKKWTQNGLNHNNEVPNLYYKNEKNILFKSKKIGKNKFKSIENFFEPLIQKDKIFFADFSGNIYNYSLDGKQIIWKFNFYKKRYKNFPIKIQLSLFENNLIVSDNLGYFYSINIETTKINWAKNYGIAFNSNLKIKDNKIFL